MSMKAKPLLGGLASARPTSTTNETPTFQALRGDSRIDPDECSYRFARWVRAIVEERYGDAHKEAAELRRLGISVVLAAKRRGAAP